MNMDMEKDKDIIKVDLLILRCNTGTNKLKSMLQNICR
jgi:hypothetical protein